MTSRADFTATEWELISAFPSQAAIAAAVSDGVTVIGTVRELNEGLKAIEAGPADYPGNELIAAVVHELIEQTREADEADRMIAEGGAPPPADDDLDELPIEATEPGAETNPDFTEEVATTASPADAVAALEIPEVDPRDPSGFVHEVIATAMQVRELLLAKVPEDEADGYRAWVNSVVERVVNRTKSGGFLGIGGERVGDEEERFRAELLAALSG